MLGKISDIELLHWLYITGKEVRYHKPQCRCSICMVYMIFDVKAKDRGLQESRLPSLWERICHCYRVWQLRLVSERE